MAIATATAVMGGIGLAKGVADTISAGKRQKQAQAELDAYQRQELENVYKNMPISTIGSDVMREESSRNIATAMNAIGNAGARAIIGATPKLVAEQNNVNRNIQKELDDQVVRRNYAIAGDNSRIQQMQEQRENADLAGLGNAINTARHDKNMGLNTIINSGMLAASGLEGTIGGDDTTPPREAVNSAISSGLQSRPINSGRNTPYVSPFQQHLFWQPPTLDFQF